MARDTPTTPAPPPPAVEPVASVDADAAAGDAGADWRRWAARADQDGADLLRARFAAGDTVDASGAVRGIRAALGRLLDHLAVAPAGLLPPADRLDMPEILLLDCAAGGTDRPLEAEMTDVRRRHRGNNAGPFPGRLEQPQIWMIA